MKAEFSVLQTLKIQGISSLGLGVVLMLPWMNPFAPGPSPNVMPWLISAFCMVILWLYRGKLTVELVAGTWMLAAGASAAAGFLQYFVLADGWNPWISQPNPGVAFANLRQRNQFASLTSIGLLALLWKVAQPSGSLQGKNDSAWRSVAWVCMGVLLLALGNAVSSSRTGLLQWLLIPVLTMVWSLRGQRRPLVTSVSALIAYLVASLAMPWLLESILGMAGGGLLGRFNEASGCESRRVLWANVLHLIAQKPWLGWGLGELRYAHFVTLFPGARFCEALGNAHNLPLHLAVELGVPFALSVCVAGVWWVLRLKPWREVDPTRQLAWGILAVILMYSMVEYPLWYGPFEMAAILSFWLLWRTPPTDLGPTISSPNSVNLNNFFGLSSAFSTIAGGLAISVIAYGMWDYRRVSQLYLAPRARAIFYQSDTISKVRSSWLFRDQVLFAELVTTRLTPENAFHLNMIAMQLLHYSPERRVVKILIESAKLLGRDEEASFYLERFRAAFP